MIIWNFNLCKVIYKVHLCTKKSHIRTEITIFVEENTAHIQNRALQIAKAGILSSKNYAITT